ncbi:NAD(P)-dependent oxidoreductase [Subtercola lobariae]|uniref:NAD-dependent epimerase n=1 Tax=Subtercola lobariae TaxID=1588641 RepID=A0A917B9P9_9MICO|nr:NAD(P)H-binding protein [Subtercola lobariae]GGF31696.1 NAD-dependent epimerase [Subtercola lobariae]
MTRIVILGGTGYAGTAIATEAASRGHEVTVFSRSAPEEPVAGVTSITGSARDHSDLERAVTGADVVVVSLAPSGDLDGEFVRVNADIANLAQEHGARLGVVGGAGTLLLSAEGPKAHESPYFPAEFRPYSEASDAVLQALRSSDPELDWFVLSPPRGFGRFAPADTTGHYRVGGDVVMSSGETPAAISVADFAVAFVDEIELPTHQRERFTVAH